MNYQYSDIALISMITAVLSGAIAHFTWRRREIPGVAAVSLLMLAIVEWTLCRAFEALSTGMSTKIVWAKLEYLGILSVPVLWLIFVLRYTRKDGWLSVRNIALLWVLPLVTLAMVATNELHGLIWSRITPSPGRELEILVYEHGTWFWIQAVYSYVVLFGGTLILARVILTQWRLYTYQSLTLLLAALFPWIGNAIYLLGYSPIHGLDLTPLSFTLTGLVVGWSIFKYKLFDLVPVARDVLIENMDDGIVVIDAKDRIVDINSAAKRLFGKTHNILVGQTINTALKQWPDLVAGYHEKTEKRMEITLGDETNPPIYADLSISCIEDQCGRQTGKLLIFRDITERKRAEITLQESEGRYRSLVENTLDGYFICELPSGRFLFFNKRLCELGGYTKEEGLKLTIWDVTYPAEHQTIRERIQARMERTETSHASNLYWANRKDGSTFKAEVSTSLVMYQGQPVLQGVIRDVTERERLRKQLQRAKRMEAIGTLAGGIAHDFNNLLMGIQGNASLVILDTPPDHPHHEKLKNIEQYIRNGADLTKQLLGFAKGGKYEVKPTGLNDLIKKTSEMFGRTKKEIVIHSKFEEALWTVEVDRGQIEQVLMNLYVNAWQAMPGGGELMIETRNIVFDEDKAHPYGLDPGRYAQISLKDTGIGMDAKTRARIFDPFFTTKEMGRGMGLGLASVYGIIRNHSGIIEVTSEKGKGSTFDIYLPASDRDILSETGRPESILKGKETALLVDDEDMIIDIGRQLLEKLGYRVLIAKSGREALKCYEKKWEQIDMVILDMIMPEMSGGETYDRMKEINPSMKALLSSGYSIDGQATDIIERGCQGFIQKPFKIHELSQKVREILD